MYSLVFRIGIGALVAMLAIMISVEVAAEVWSVDRSGNGVQLWLRVGTGLLWVAVIAGCVLYPEAWRLYKTKRPAMNSERRHFWIMMLVFGLFIAGYASHIYLRDDAAD